jgi:hypothetical protein
MYDSGAMQLLVEIMFTTLTDYWIGLKRVSASKPYVFTTGGWVGQQAAVAQPTLGCFVGCASSCQSVFRIPDVLMLGC